MISNEKMKKREEKYIEMLRELYGNDFTYEGCDVVEVPNQSKYRYYIHTKCTDCGAVRKKDYTSVSKGFLKCLCRDEPTMKKSAQKYAKILYTSLAGDAKVYGFLSGRELEDYVKRCTEYDRPEVSKNVKYINFVLDFLNEEYIKNNVKPCRCCKRLLTENSMYFYNKTICVPCHKEQMRQKREQRAMEKARRSRRKK